MLATQRPQERLEHTVLTDALVAADQDGMVHLDVGMLNLERHNIQNVVQFDIVRDQVAAVRQPRLNVMVRDCVAVRHVGARVRPPVAVDQPVTRHQNVVTSGERHRRQRRRATVLSALVVVDRRLHTLFFVVDRPAVNVPVQRVEDVARHLLARH